MQTTALIVCVRGTNNIAVSALEEVIALRRDLNDEFSTTMVKVAMLLVPRTYTMSAVVCTNLCLY